MLRRQRRRPGRGAHSLLLTASAAFSPPRDAVGEARIRLVMPSRISRIRPIPSMPRPEGSSVSHISRATPSGGVTSVVPTTTTRSTACISSSVSCRG